MSDTSIDYANAVEMRDIVLQFPGVLVNDHVDFTLKHGEIKQLDMPPMTMVFTAKDKALLDAVKIGDKVKFMAVNDNGMMVVTDIQQAK
mgnify:CR=1 FL=1